MRAHEGFEIYHTFQQPRIVVQVPTPRRGQTSQWRTQKISMVVFQSMAYRGNLHLMCVLCDVTI